MSKRSTAATATLEWDQNYKLTLDHTALWDFQELTGINIFDAEEYEARTGKPLMKGIFEAKNLASLVWACMGGEDAPLKVREVGRLLHPGNMQETVVVINDLMERAFGTVTDGASEGKKERPKKGAATD
jgi:hypothetical protein